MNISPVSAMLHGYMSILSYDDVFKQKSELVPWLWRRYWDWKGFQSDWLSLPPVQGRELVQVAGEHKVPAEVNSDCSSLLMN